MKSRTVEFLVGLFILVSAVCLVYLALNVSGLASSSSGSNYTVNAHFRNISGLTERAKVSIAGVAVGQVSSIIFDPEEKSALVSMEIDGDVDFLTTDTSASILTAGLLGEKYIGLSLGADEEFLEDDDLIFDTQSALVLENLIGDFILNMGQ